MGLISGLELLLPDELPCDDEISAYGFGTVCGAAFFGIAIIATPTAQNIVTTEQI